MKWLIVEDQSATLENLEEAVLTIVPRYFPGFTKDDYKVVRDFNRANTEAFSQAYDFVLLDHRLPNSYSAKQEKEDFRAFSQSLENVGYILIPIIKKTNPKTVIIGTSSLSSAELELKHRQAPDFKMSKMHGEAERDLDAILREVIARGKT